MNAYGLKELAEEYFAPHIRDIILKAAEAEDPIEELRFCAERPLAVYKRSGLSFLGESGNLEKAENAAIIKRCELTALVNSLCENSLYSYQNQLTAGYVTLKGGHRAGITGRVITDKGKITYITDISSVNIRIAKEVKGAAKTVIPYIAGEGVKSTLIISPPGCGKTTMLRDIARVLGGASFTYKTAIVDERGEIAASRLGVPTNDVGSVTVVLDNCPKTEGMLMLLRSMSPEIIITDEIGTAEDANAVKQILNAGVKVICSAHGYNREDAMRREGIRELMKAGAFELVVILSRRSGPGTVEEIFRV
ncbi:MAG: stage III sporulation protein AA [Bacillota bacterium]|nr:stage III sporulation protein AA [Bacillota bacterium]